MGDALPDDGAAFAVAIIPASPRGDEVFAGLDALVAQLRRDEAAARAYLGIDAVKAD